MPSSSFDPPIPPHPNTTPNWEPRTTHSTTPAHTHTNGHLTPPPPPNPSPHSPAALTLRAHLLGLTLGASLTLTPLLLSPAHYTPLWRLPLFLSLLSLFHWLEFYTTAIYNPPSATVSAFLLQNGWGYTFAHGFAFLEAGVRWTVWPETGGLPRGWGRVGVWVGVGFVVVGQGVRTAAMAQAGRNFNHLVQSRKREGHVLVTGRVYAWLRHPSYFGFFWWAVGTQVLLGNVVGVVLFVVVLWRFFSARVAKEERFLVGFFGQEYVQYRARTRVGIPFIP